MNSWKLKTETYQQYPGLKAETAVNLDLCQHGVEFLPASELASGKSFTLSGPSVLQIVNVKNLSAPSINPSSQGAPRMLRVRLTDGFSKLYAIELEEIPGLSLKTPAGSKLELQDASVANGFLLLTKQNCRVLGGRVPELVERWQMQQDLASIHRSGVKVDGRPPFVPFSQKSVAEARKAKETRLSSVKQAPAEAAAPKQAKAAPSSGGTTVAMIRERVDDGLSSSVFSQLQDAAEQKRQQRWKSRGRRNRHDDQEESSGITMEEYLQQQQQQQNQPQPHQQQQQRASQNDGNAPSDEKVAVLLEMGFTASDAVYALKKNNSSVEQAIEYLMTRPSAVDTPVSHQQTDSKPVAVHSGQKHARQDYQTSKSKSKEGTHRHPSAREGNPSGRAARQGDNVKPAAEHKHQRKHRDERSQPSVTKGRKNDQKQSKPEPTPPSLQKNKGKNKGRQDSSSSHAQPLSSSKASQDTTFAVGQYCEAKWHDRRFYRALVKRVATDKDQFHVEFCDYPEEGLYKTTSADMREDGIKKASTGPAVLAFNSQAAPNPSSSASAPPQQIVGTASKLVSASRASPSPSSPSTPSTASQDKDKSRKPKNKPAKSKLNQKSVPSKTQGTTRVAADASAAASAASAAATQPLMWTKGQQCLAQYPEDGRWYKAKIVRLDTDKQLCAVFWLDYSETTEHLDLSKLKPLS